MSKFVNTELKNLFDLDWQWELADNPEFASQAGQHDIACISGHELQDVSPGAYELRRLHSEEMLVAVRRIIAQGGLTKEESIYASLFERSHAEIITGIDTAPMYMIPINSMMAGGVLFSFAESIEWMRFESVADFQLYEKRVRAFPRQTTQFIDAMRAGLARGYVASVAMTSNVAGFIESFLSGDLAEFFAPLNDGDGPSILASSPGLKESLENAIAGVKPAIQIFKGFYETEYVPALRQEPGCSSLPNGYEAYCTLLKCHTTTELTPDEVHEIGLQEVAKIEERYRKEVLLPLGFEEDKFNDFVEFVRSDRQFYVDSAEALLQIYRDTCKKIDVLMPNYFNEIPKSPLQITSKNGGPAAYYLAGTADGKRPGRFYVNVSHIEKRPVYENVSLSLHEAIPGHHHQASIALEAETIPNVSSWRRFSADLICELSMLCYVVLVCFYSS
jgi:uncharacterized protein (DUF885 family)